MKEKGACDGTLQLRVEMAENEFKWNRDDVCSMIMDAGTHAAKFKV